MSVSSSTVIGIAERDVGVTESPPGSNRGKRIDEMADALRTRRAVAVVELAGMVVLLVLVLIRLVGGWT